MKLITLSAYWLCEEREGVQGKNSHGVLAAPGEEEMSLGLGETEFNLPFSK